MQFVILFEFIFFIFCAFAVSQIKTNVFTDERTSFDLIERQTHLITAGFSNVFWTSVRRSITSHNISSQCSSHLDKLVQSTLTGQPWVFKLLSASGSRPNNFLDGTYATFGSYDSCLAISASFGTNEDDKIKGQYCLTSLEPDFSDDPTKTELLGQIYPHIFDSTYNLTVKVGLCVPSSCSSADVGQLMRKALSDYSWKLIDVHQCEVETTFLNRLKSAKIGQQIFMFLLTVLTIIIILGTLIDIKARSTPFPSADPKTLTFWIQQFSVIKSVRSLLRKPDESPRVLVIDQLRVGSLILVLIIHAFMWFTMIYTPFIAEDVQKGLEVIKKPDIQPWINDWATEGLMFIGGSSAATNLLYKMKPETPITVYLYTIFRRAALLAPIMLVLIGIDVVSPFFGSGPIYNPINQYRSDVCVKNFMYNIFHIQNHCKQLEVCAPHTWSFAVEWQLFIFMCVAVYIYKRSNYLGFVFNIFMILFGFYRINSIFYNYNIIPNFVMANFNAKDFANRMSNYYIATGSHIWSYFWSLLLVVIMLGNYESKIDKIRSQLTKIVVGLTILHSYSSIPWNVFGMKVEPTTTIIYISICKIITGLFFTVIIFPYGKQFRKFLANSKSNDMQVYIEDEINQNTSFSQELNQQSPEQCIKTVEYNSQSLTIKNLHLFEVILRILKSSYFIHASIYSWYYTSLRTTILSNFSNYLANVVILFISTIFGGFVFYLFIIGPVERITFVLSKKTKPMKPHAS